MKRLEENPWWPELVAKKDTMSLRELAKEFGSTAGSINKALKRNGLERQHAPSGPRSARAAGPAKAAKKAAPKKAAAPKAATKKTAPKKAAAPKAAAPKAAAPKADAPKAAAPKAEKKAKSGKKPGPKGLRGSTMTKLGPYMSMLGEVADGEIASMAGVSTQTVARVRKDKGIAPKRGRGGAKAAKAAAPRRRPGRPSKITPFEEKLATHSDAEVAAMAGVSENAVRNYRKRHGLADGPKAPASIAKAAAPKAAAPKAKAAATTAIAVGQRAYRVQLGDRTAIVVGSNLVEAARKAVESGSEVSSIELLGDILA